MVLFLHRGLMLSGPRLYISLGGFWKLRWLRVDGVAALAAACSF